MPSLTQIPLDYDIDFIREKMLAAGIASDYTIAEGATAYTVVFRAGVGFDTIEQIISDYPTTYVDEVLRPEALAAVTALRKEKEKEVPFMGGTIEGDLGTIAKTTAAAFLMTQDPNSPQTRRWKTGPGAEDWVTVDSTMLMAMTAAIADHMQTCFDHEEQLSIALRAATTVDELTAIDIEAGWPA